MSRLHPIHHPFHFLKHAVSTVSTSSNSPENIFLQESLKQDQGKPPALHFLITLQKDASLSKKQNSWKNEINNRDKISSSVDCCNFKEIYIFDDNDKDKNAKRSFSFNLFFFFCPRSLNRIEFILNMYKRPNMIICNLNFGLNLHNWVII